MILAIDGTTASGKGTIGRRLAGYYGLAYLDTGLLYRAVGRAALDQGLALDDPEACAEVAQNLVLGQWDEARLRTAEAGQAASQVAVHRPVRAALLDAQRNFARQDGGAVLDGRDIGTVVCPEADVKLWVDADVHVRAQRRWAELRDKPGAPSLDEMIRQLKDRDARDANRSDAPARAAEDAHLLDTTSLDIDAAVASARRIIDAARAS